MMVPVRDDDVLVCVPEGVEPCSVGTIRESGWVCLDVRIHFASPPLEFDRMWERWARIDPNGEQGGKLNDRPQA